MARSSTSPTKSKRSRYVVAAMVLGSALSAMGAAPNVATPGSQVDVHAVQDISRYCTACWRNARLSPDSWNDCTQEVFCRLLERVDPDGWERMLKDDEGDERREFLRAIDTVKKRTQRARRWAPMLPDDAVADQASMHESRVNDDRNAMYQAADRILTSRQQRIIRLSAEGWSVHDIARNLQISTERVSDEKYKAIRKLRQHLNPEETAA
jgi:RNA polymerase sigma factor (sigma-70 family)